MHTERLESPGALPAELWTASAAVVEVARFSQNVGLECLHVHPGILQGPTLAIVRPLGVVEVNPA